MLCPCCMDSVGISILVLSCSWWHLRQANDGVASDQRIFSESGYKCFRDVVN